MIWTTVKTQITHRLPRRGAERIGAHLLSRRTFLIGGVSLLSGCSSTVRDVQIIAPEPYADEQFPVRLVNRARFADHLQPRRIRMVTGQTPGTIIIDTGSFHLYRVETVDTVMRYGVAVGASGHGWKGEAIVGRKAKWPAWYPTDDMHSQTPGLPRRIEPGPANPLGARALYLFSGGRDTLYRIHGTSEPWTIGTEASSGCIRMLNEDVIDLYEQVRPGDAVIVR